MTGLGLLVLRLCVAAVCVMHGAHKLFGFGGGVGTGVGPGGLNDTAQHFSQIGLNPGFLLAVIAGLTQFAGGLLLGVGFLTRWAAAALGVYFLVGIWKEHSPWGFFLNWTHTPTLGHGYEYAFVMLAALVCLALAGGGEWSLDGRRAKSAESLAAGRARLRGHG
jgi:putative oxidoreductase